jgi:heme/copper-type cytochrome/quinol oxidase subunit 2
MTSRFSSLVGTALGQVSVVPVAGLAQRPPVRAIQIEARKFEPAVFEVTAGESVRLVLHSADAAHGFESKDLTLNLKLPRSGATVTAEFSAPTPGRYAITCSRMCGRGHHQMKAALVSVPAQRPGTNR